MTAYATVEELKARIDPSGVLSSERDSIFTNNINAASAAIDHVCGQKIIGTTETRVYTAEWTDVLSIDPAIEITQVQTDDDGDGVYQYTWTANTDYMLEPYNARLDGKPYLKIRTNPHRGSYAFPANVRQGVRVTGTFGYDSSVPALVKEACLLIASRLHRRKDAPFGVVGAGDLGQAIVIASKDPDVKMCLQQYLRWIVEAV